MSEFLHSELFAVTLTIGLFWGAQLIQKKLRSVILNPILVAIILIILILKVGNISYETYYEGGKYIEFLLKPEYRFTSKSNRYANRPCPFWPASWPVVSWELPRLSLSHSIVERHRMLPFRLHQNRRRRRSPWKFPS